MGNTEDVRSKILGQKLPGSSAGGSPLSLPRSGVTRDDIIAGFPVQISMKVVFQNLPNDLLLRAEAMIQKEMEKRGLLKR